MGDVKSKPSSCAPGPLSTDMVELLQRYIDESVAESGGNPMDASADVMLETPDPNAAPGDRNGDRTKYKGLAKTTTGVVAMLREQGKEESADLLEDLRLTRNAAAVLLDKLRDLHKLKTGSYPSITIARTAKKDR